MVLEFLINARIYIVHYMESRVHLETPATDDSDVCRPLDEWRRMILQVY